MSIVEGSKPVLVVFLLVLVAALEHAAVDEDAVSGHFQEVAGSGDLQGGAVGCQSAL